MKITPPSRIRENAIMWHASTDTPPVSSNNNSKKSNQLTYLSPGLVVSLSRRDLISALVSAGCHHLAVKIFRYLDSTSLLSCSLVCVDWQRMLLESVYTARGFRKGVRAAIFGGRPRSSKIELTLANKSAAVVDVTVDDDFNVFALGSLGNGNYHVMSCSLFGQGKKRWVHRLPQEETDPDFAVISAGHSMVALGGRDGRIHLYECERRCLRKKGSFAHHSSAIRGLAFDSGRRHLVSCSDDMTLGVMCLDNSNKTRLLHGHVSRVRALDVQGGRILSGSDDRSVKLWSSATDKPLSTMTGHSGPVTGVQLSMPLALSSSGSTVRLWNALQGTCLKLLQHQEDCPVTTMTWISTFKGVATVDISGKLRCFDLFDLETTNHEIVVASGVTRIHEQIDYHPSPKQKVKGGSIGSNNSNSSSNSNDSNNRLIENAVFKLESIPHHFSAFSLSNSPLPTVTLHCLDYVH